MQIKDIEFTGQEKIVLGCIIHVLIGNISSKYNFNVLLDIGDKFNKAGFDINQIPSDSKYFCEELAKQL